MYTENYYRLGLRNRYLGIALRALPVEDANSHCYVREFDGAHFELQNRHVCALTHAYSITVRKSLESEFDRVIVLIRKSRLLDQVLIYAAITLWNLLSVILGDAGAVRSVVAAPASQRTDLFHCRKGSELQQSCGRYFLRLTDL